PTSRPSCARTGCRSGPPTPHRGTCTICPAPRLMTSSPLYVGPPRNWTCPPSPTPATKAPEPVSTPRSNNPPTAPNWLLTTGPTTRCFEPTARPPNAASPSSPAVGAAYATPPPAPEASATSSAPASSSPISSTGTYPILVEITSLDPRPETNARIRPNGV